MVDLLAIGVIAVGVLLLFAGAALSVYSVAVLGLLIGGGSGYLIAPTIAGVLTVDPTVTSAVIVLVLGVAGALLAYTLLSVAIAGAGFVAGGLLGQFVINPVFVEGAWYVEWTAIVAAAFGGALFGFVLSKTALVFITSFIGAALASTQLTIADMSVAREQLSIDPLLIEPAPLFVGLLVLGVLSQFGLFKFGYVTKIASALPGGRVIQNRGDDPA